MQNFIITLLVCSVSMSALALAYMAVTPFLAKRYSEKWRYYAWLVIIVGLIIPFRPQWGNTLLSVEVSTYTLPSIMQMNGEMLNYFIPPTTFPPVDYAAILYTDTTLNISWMWWNIAASLWLVGTAIFIVYHGIKHCRCMNMIRRWSDSITDKRALSLFESLKSEMGISKHIPLYICECVDSPMMIGVIKPRILLPTVELAQDELCFILKHELVHYKRKDLLYKGLVLIATTFHWFNPVVHLISMEINNLCETSCDSEVVKNMDADMRLSYSETIIGVAKYQSKLKTTLSTNFYGGRKGMSKRISSIMDMKKKRMGLAVICMVSVLTIGTGFVVAANSNTQGVADNHYTAYALDNSENDRWWPVPESLGLRPFNSDRTISISLPFSLTLGADGENITSRNELAELIDQLGLYAEIGSEHQDMSFGELALWLISNSGEEIISSLKEQNAPQWITDDFLDGLG